jgi:hypothetical protein
LNRRSVLSRDGNRPETMEIETGINKLGESREYYTYGVLCTNT